MADFSFTRPLAGTAIFIRSHQARPQHADGSRSPLPRKNRNRVGRDAGLLQCTWHSTEQGDLVCIWNTVPTP